MDELVSVIMPAYNCEKYIAEAIKSVINQTYTNWELIVVDDCSTDNTFEIITLLQNDNAKIRVFKNVFNSGVSATRNKGISESKGEWIAFLDSDDMWDEKKLDKQIRYAQVNKVGLIFTGAAYVDENGNMYKWVFEIPEKVSYKDLLKQNVISCSSVLVRKTCLRNAKMENDRIHEDFCVWLKVLRVEEYAYGVNEPLLIYRISRNSKSGNKIKSLEMAYKTYRYIGINPILSCYYMIYYIVRNIKKYRNIFKSNL